MKISCNEIYYASNQKSALTGNDGFGVRTFTSGMDSALVASIARHFPGYQVNPERQLSLDDLIANPRVVYDYPPVYSFTRHTADDGTTLWVTSRTVYIASDYGFFLGGNAYSRVGSNYYTHAIITREVPDPRILAAMVADGTFVPRDYTMDPANAEMISLLTGEPALLPPREIELPAPPATVNPRCIPILNALLQAVINRATGTSAELTKIIIKAPAADTADIVSLLASMPAAMMPHMRFATNFMKGYGVPDDLDIIIVNEHNYLPLYEGNYITVDLMGQKSGNITPNYIADRAAEALERGNPDLARDIINFFLGLEHASKPDYKFLYNLYLAVNTPAPITLTEIDESFLSQLGGAPLTTPDRDKIARKISDAVNEALIYSEDPAMVNAAFNTMTLLSRQRDINVDLRPEARTRVTKLVMGVQSYIDRIVTDANADAIISMLARNDVAGDTDFFNAMHLLDNPTLWKKFLNFYYGGSAIPPQATDSVISAILGSKLNPIERERLIGQLFPAASSQRQLLDYLRAYPGRIPSMPVTVAALADSSRDEIFSTLIEASMGDVAVIKALGAPVRSFFSRRISESPDAGMRELMAFITRISPATFATLGDLDLFNSYLHHALNHPGPQVKATLQALASLNLPAGVMARHEVQLFSAILDLFDTKVPQYVNCNIMLVADKMNQSPEFFTRLFDRWLDSGATTDDFAVYVHDARNISAASIGTMVWVSWRKFINRPADREMWVSKILGSCKWDASARKSFIAECPDRELVQYINNEDKLTNRLIKRLKNLF